MALFGSKKTQDDKKKTSPDASAKESVKKAKKVVKKESVAKKDSGSMKDLYSEGTKTVVKGGKAKAKFSPLNNLLIKPLVTEKATTLSANGKYVFIVANSANKISVAKALESVYGVKAVSVNIVNMKGKAVTRGKIKGKRKDFKKAIVTLAKGETIAIYEGV